MKIDSTIYMPNKDIKKNELEQKGEEVFKKIFIENMVKEMLKDTKLLPSSNQTQREMFMDQMKEVLSDKLMESTDIRWQELLKMNKE